jgi:hypothetical protein
MGCRNITCQDTEHRQCFCELQQQLKSARFASSLPFAHRWIDFETELAKREAAQKRGLWQRLKTWSKRWIPVDRSKAD